MPSTAGQMGEQEERAEVPGGRLACDIACGHQMPCSTTT